MGAFGLEQLGEQTPEVRLAAEIERLCSLPEDAPRQATTPTGRVLFTLYNESDPNVPGFRRLGLGENEVLIVNAHDHHERYHFRGLEDGGVAIVDPHNGHEQRLVGDYAKQQADVLSLFGQSVDFHWDEP